METKTLESKLLDFQKKVTVIKKDAKNPHFKNTYASLSQIIGEVKPILTECGLILLQPMDLEKGIGTRVGANGEFVEAFIPFPVGLTAQQMGSAITYYRRYTLASLLALEMEDDDGTEASKPAPKPYLNENSEQFEKAQQFIASGGSIDDIKKKYNVSATVEKLLIP